MGMAPAVLTSQPGSGGLEHLSSKYDREPPAATVPSANYDGPRRRRRTSDVAAQVYRILRARASGRELAGWSVAYLAGRARRPRRSVFRALARLEREGRIRRERTTQPVRGRSRTLYRILAPLTDTPATCRVTRYARNPTPRRHTGPIAQPGQLLKALATAYPDAPPAARRAWVALANRMPPRLLELGHGKLRELASCTRLRCRRAVWYRWAVDLVSRWDPSQVPACSRRHMRPWSRHWRTAGGQLEVDPGPLPAAVAQLVAAAVPRVSRTPAPAVVSAVTAPAARRPQVHTDVWLLEQAAAQDLQGLDLAFVRRYVERRRQLSPQGAPCSHSHA